MGVEVAEGGQGVLEGRGLLALREGPVEGGDSLESMVSQA